MKLDWKMTLWCSSIGLLISPLAHAQFCSLTNASLIGTYGYTASEAGAVSSSGSSGSSATSTGSATGTGSTATTTGTNTGTSGAISLTSNGYSNTELGQLLSGIGSGNQFTAAGAFTFDGAGNINAIASPANNSLACWNL